MTKKKVANENQTEDSAFELIELAINDIELLTKAFHVMDTVCDELDAQEEDADDDDFHGIPEQMMH